MMRPTPRFLLAAVAASLIALAARATLAGRDAGSSSGQAGIPSFREFVEALRAAKYEQYAARAGNKVAGEGAFAEMKAHALGLYEGIDAGQVRRSFADAAGSIFDCIPVGQQPALRASRPATPPSAPPDPPRPGGRVGGYAGRATASPPPRDIRRDQHGDAALCAPGAIPMRRITLENLTRFATLRDFLRK
jgi:hypothetical protein